MNWERLRAEIDAHIEEKALELIESGVGEPEAWERARREFGNATRVMETSRAVWVWTWLEELTQELRYGLRAMGANRLFTLLAVASLALGIGANTAIYSFMEAILLRPLPVNDPASVVALKFHRPKRPRGETRGFDYEGNMSNHITSGGSFDGNYSVFPYPAFEMFEQRSDLFAATFAYHGQPEARLTVNGAATLGDSVYVSGGFFAGLGASPAFGRALTPEDDRLGAPSVAVVSAGFAQQSYGSASSTLGKTVGVNGRCFTVVGVTAPDFFGVNPEWTPKVYLPLHSYLQTQASRFTEDGKLLSDTASYWLDVMARLQPGVTRERAQAALDPAFAEYFKLYSGTTHEKPRMLVMDGARGLDSLRHRYSQPLYVLMAMVVLILAIACSNIANLLAGARFGSAPRNGRAAEFGRKPLPRHPPVAYRESSPLSRRRSLGTAGRLLERTHAHGAAGDGARGVHLARRLERGRTCRNIRRRGGRRSGFRPRPGMAGDARRCLPCLARSPLFERGRRTPMVSHEHRPSSGRRANRPFLPAAGGCGIVRANFDESAIPSTRIQSGKSPAPRDQHAAGGLPGRSGGRVSRTDPAETRFGAWRSRRYPGSGRAVGWR
jgi:MacB-like periplasmic core domain